ncbi:hypothetical protein MMC15_006089 [Xylographa vitiligo]|nr:hypothetical protein [Xylographa vitiligo]
MFFKFMDLWLQQHLSVFSLISLCFAGCWVGWRIWTFTILPALRPNEPKQLPYMIPFLGHAISFARDMNGTISYGRRYFKDSRETFAITIAGETIYIMISALDIFAALKNLDDFVFDSPITDMMYKFDITKSAIDILYEPPPQAIRDSKTLEPNPLGRNMAHLGESFMKKQLNPGKTFEEFQTVFLDLIDRKMTWDNIPAKAVLSATEHPPERLTSLLEWTRQTLVESNTIAFFGPAILRIDPTLVDTSLRFDDRMWKLLFSVPRPFATDMLRSKRQAHRAIIAYLALPQERRPGAAWLARTLEAEMRARGIADHDIAAWLLMIHWSLNTNTWRLAFWVLAYLLHHSALLALVRAEVHSAVHGLPPSSSSSSSLPALAAALSRAPHLAAHYNEVLRLVNGPISIRHVARPLSTAATHKSLLPGRKLLMFHRELLLDAAAFGADATAYNPARFLDNEPLLRSKSFTPFGGGAMLCPGRFMARDEVLLFVARALGRFDLRVVEGRGFPRLDVRTAAGVGILGPVGGDDVVVRVREREG